jgi:pimeloyl-ACP methyl ester carboxylesterase
MRISIGDCRLFVDVDGVGLVPDGPTMRQRPTLIALHGGPGLDHTSFKPEFGTLSDVAQIVYVDHRGQGRSDRSTPDRWNLAQWADDVVAVCDALCIDDPIVYGVSFGGMVALQYAVRHPGHASKVILDSTAAVPDISAMLEVFERLGGPEAVEVADRFWSNDVTSASFAEYLARCMPLYSRRHHPDAELRTARSFEHGNLELFQRWSSTEHRTFDLTGSLDRVTARVLVLSGEDDPVTPTTGARLLADGIGADLATLEVFADCGHGVWRDQPDAAFAVLRRFIES